MILMGIDPSLNNIGYHFFYLDNNYNIKDVFYEMYPIDSNWTEEKKLWIINCYTNYLMDLYKIDYIAMEEFHFNPKRAKAALKVSESIGIIKSIIYKKNIIAEYISPQAVKKLTGNGKADKLMVAKFISEKLNINLFELTNKIRIKTTKKQEYVEIKEVYSYEELVKNKKEHITDALSIGYVLVLKLKEEGGESLR